MLTKAKSRIPHVGVSDHIAARVLLARDDLLSGEFADDLKDLLFDRGVLILDRVNFSDEEQVRFTKTLGHLEQEPHDGEEVYKITRDKGENDLADYMSGTFYWHFDGFMSEIPLRASILSCKALPVTGEGGDTEFANTRAAYESLPEERKRQIEGLRAIHSLATTQLSFDPQPTYENFMDWLAKGRRELPIVWRHESGDRSLAIGASALSILDMDPLDAKELLVFLLDWATQDQFRYRHQWAVGDTVLWDNTCTLHRAIPYAKDSGRLMHRTKLRGTHHINA